jgi:hypothetical protein
MAAWIGARAAHQRQARRNAAAAPNALDVSSPLNQYFVHPVKRDLLQLLS